ncbi:MAG: MBL fold metallo-hydrolase [Candidatus Thorarchaeota archaeon]|nr:MAG: MBL fold metallo-hydrolase [Candidatus Thorarchaeota archaeon]
MAQLEEITPHVVAITTGWSGGNVGGIELDSFSVAVDTTKNYSLALEFRKALENCFNKQVKHAFLTHHHSDHVKGMDAFIEGSVLSSKWTASKVRSLTSVTGFPSNTFEDEYRIEDEHLHVELYHSGGHTQDSSYLYFPHEKVIFAGDLIFQGYLFFSGYKCDPIAWISTLEHFRELRPRKIIPGHGSVLSSPADLEKHITLMYRFKEAIQEGKEQNIEPRSIEVPEFVLSYSERVPEIELVKWFRRTAVSWYRHL